MGHYRYTQPAVFVDDAGKVSRNLSINLGLRYEYVSVRRAIGYQALTRPRRTA
jgi:hypothetical protein